MSLILFIFFFNDTATTEIYTLSLHDALPILLWRRLKPARNSLMVVGFNVYVSENTILRISIGIRIEGSNSRPVSSALSDRKSTRLNSSHVRISYAVFCLKKKKYTKL